MRGEVEEDEWENGMGEGMETKNEGQRKLNGKK
jgi:hypothetical protein